MQLEDLKRYDCEVGCDAYTGAYPMMSEYRNGEFVRYDDVVALIKSIESDYKKYEEEKTKKKMEENSKKIEDYFANVSSEHIHKAMYGDDYKRLKLFDRKLWEKMIDEQLEFSDEDLFYSTDEELKPFKDKSFFYSVDNSLNERFQADHVQVISESDFPTLFYIVKHNDKEMFVVTMIGQGSITNTCTREHFIEWMNNCGNKYEIDENIFITIDEMEALVNLAIEENKDLE